MTVPQGSEVFPVDVAGRQWHHGMKLKRLGRPSSWA
jgi:hypothetical protein